MQSPFVRGARLVASAATAFALVVAGSVSASLAQSGDPSTSPEPSTSPAIVQPWRTVEAGTCDPSFHGLCSTVAVAQWPSIAHTPLVDCGFVYAPSKCRLQTDISAPTSGGPWPIVVFLPGGPASPGSLVGGPDPFAAALAGQGAVVMISAWREGKAYGAGYPTSFADVACAVGVARAIGPAYGGDPDRVTLAGHSTGGWPAMVVGVTPTPFAPIPGSCDATAGSLRPDAAVSVDGDIAEVTALEDGHDYVVGFMGGEQAAKPEAWAASDPFALVQRYPADAYAVPFLLIHGADDNLVPPIVSEDFQAALVAAGYDSRLLIIPGAGHVEALFAKDAIDAIMEIATGK